LTKKLVHVIFGEMLREIWEMHSKSSVAKGLTGDFRHQGRDTEIAPKI
jgi:hypothetical protein